MIDLDSIKIAALLAAFFINWRVFIVALIWSADIAARDIAPTGVSASFSSAILFCIPALMNIKFSDKIHQAFICLAAINWIALIDYTFFDYETTFYLCYPWLIHGIDTWIIWQFLSGGGKQNVGSIRKLLEDFIFSVRCRILWLSSIHR